MYATEAAISFALMSVVLAVSASRRAAWTGVCAGALVFLFITFEEPLSGMSMKPGAVDRLGARRAWQRPSPPQRAAS